MDVNLIVVLGLINLINSVTSVSGIRRVNNLLNQIDDILKQFNVKAMATLHEQRTKNYIKAMVIVLYGLFGVLLGMCGENVDDFYQKS